jgi:hypothetical protein
MSMETRFWYTAIQKICLFCLKSIALGPPSTLLPQIFASVDDEPPPAASTLAEEFSAS